MTKKQESMLWSYEHARCTTLYEAYNKCSRAKEQAYQYCLELMARLNGYGGRITGASSHFFSFAFKYYDADIHKECLCYCTHANDYKFPIE